MTITAAGLQPFAVSLNAGLTTAHGSLAQRRGWLVRLNAAPVDGGDPTATVGWGVATPVSGFSGGDFEASGARLAEVLPTILHRALDEVRVACRAIADPIVRAAVQTALLDLESRGLGAPLAARLSAGRSARPGVVVNGLADGDTPDALGRSVRALAEFSVVKIKASGSLADAIRRVEVATDVLASGQRLRVDLNGSLAESDALTFLRAVAGAPIEFVEQPTAELAALARLRAHEILPLAADELATDLASARAVLAAGAADVLILKPMISGGPIETIQMADEAAASGVGVVVTSVLDSGLGVLAALHTAAALPVEPLACGLATAAMLHDDIVEVPRATAGRIEIPPGAGLGCTPSQAALSRLAIAEERTWN